MSNAPPPPPPLLILFTYPNSPFGRRVENYLTLRGLPYVRSPVLNRLPRPVLEDLNVHYRRIPILAIGRDIYCDSRLIIDKLEARWSPESRLGSSGGAFERGVEKLLEGWTVDGGPFARVAALTPAERLTDKAWIEDRKEMTGGRFDPALLPKGRGEALAHVRMYFALMEEGLLGDGRSWVSGNGSGGPGLGEVHAAWVFEWMCAPVMLGGVDAEVLSAKVFPRTFGWVARFREWVDGVRERAGGVVEEIGREETVSRILKAGFFEEEEGEIDPADPLKLEKGREVEVFPVDTGSNHRDRGRLVSIGRDEVVVESKTNVGEGVLRIHYPRVNIRIQPV